MSKAIAYILNPEKTDEKLLVSSYGCASETAAREFEWTRKIAEQKGMTPVRIMTNARSMARIRFPSVIFFMPCFSFL